MGASESGFSSWASMVTSGRSTLVSPVDGLVNEASTAVDTTWRAGVTDNRPPYPITPIFGYRPGPWSRARILAGWCLLFPWLGSAGCSPPTRRCSGSGGTPGGRLGVVIPRRGGAERWTCSAWPGSHPQRPAAPGWRTGTTGAGGGSFRRCTCRCFSSGSPRRSSSAAGSSDALHRNLGNLDSSVVPRGPCRRPPRPRLGLGFGGSV